MRIYFNCYPTYFCFFFLQNFNLLVIVRKVYVFLFHKLMESLAIRLSTLIFLLGYSWKKCFKLFLLIVPFVSIVFNSYLHLVTMLLNKVFLLVEFLHFYYNLRFFRRKIINFSLNCVKFDFTRLKLLRTFMFCLSTRFHLF